MNERLGLKGNCWWSAMTPVHWPYTICACAIRYVCLYVYLYTFQPIASDLCQKISKFPIKVKILAISRDHSFKYIYADTPYCVICSLCLYLIVTSLNHSFISTLTLLIKLTCTCSLTLFYRYTHTPLHHAMRSVHVRSLLTIQLPWVTHRARSRSLIYARKGIVCIK